MMPMVMRSFSTESAKRVGRLSTTQGLRTRPFPSNRVAVAGAPVGSVPMSMAHFIENTGRAPLRFLELFRAPVFVDVSLAKWMALTPMNWCKRTWTSTAPCSNRCTRTSSRWYKSL